ncbi:hypothetical protein EMPS_10512 [Entomortierella parvispora]|uniref:PWWP domain-containing protein n=1 Tax=Entomortierella parvispora TaxID=205924 RepID=A0A9P3HKN7_9FUNG|nr:hypothetical protein EMPS_10512 [Entomortierella parvispora]
MQTRRRQKQEQQVHDSHITLAPQSNEPSSVIADTKAKDDESNAVRNNTSSEAETATAPVKRTERELELPPTKYQKVEIPWSATLPQVVWVCDEKGFWWPGKLRQFHQKNNTVQVSRFGKVKPKMLTMECTEANIVPFEHPSKESHYSAGSKSAVFLNAYTEATEAQMKDDDDLPSLDDVLSNMSSTPLPAPHKNTASTNGATTTMGGTRKLSSGGSECHVDSSLSIPGELILALDGRLYYPARITSFNKSSNKYKIEFATGHVKSIERKKFYTRYEKEFQKCPLGEMAMPTVIENYREPELQNLVVGIYPELYAIIAGKEDEGGRSQAFMKGGKARLSLAQRVGPGCFNKAQYALISSMLQAEFLPDLSTTKKMDLTQENNTEMEQSTETTKNPPTSEAPGTPMKREGDLTKDFSDQMRLHFVMDVLLPQTIARLTMKRNGVDFEEAERIIQTGTRDDLDTWWVDDVLAARESFLDGGDL